MELLGEIKRILGMIEQAFAVPGAEEDPPVRCLVLASRLPGVFNMGGDLPLFVELIRDRDPDGLRHYAHACVDVQYRRWIKNRLPIRTISLVQGDALGGGFEAALADDVIIAEESAKFALPEILFNLFPGMGGLQFPGPARRQRHHRAPDAQWQDLLGGGNFTKWAWSTAWFPTGWGVEGLYDYIAETERSFASRNAVLEARRLINPVTQEELTEITDRWVEAALTLSPLDLRKMERLAAAQDRRRGRARVTD